MRSRILGVPPGKPASGRALAPWRAPTMLGRYGRFGLKILTRLAVAALVVLALLLGRLAFGPVSLSGLTPQIEAAINGGLGGWRITLADVRLGWDARRGRVRVRLSDVTLSGPDGQRVVSAPDVSLRLHLGDALRGRISVTQAEVVGLEALLLRAKSGRFRFAVLDQGGEPEEPESAEAEAAGVSPEAFDAVAAAVDAASASAGEDRGGALSRFQRLTISDLQLRYVDEMSGDDWTAPRSDLTIRRTETGLEAQLEGRVLTDPNAPPVALELSGARSAAGDALELNARFSEAPTAAFAAQIPQLAVIGKIDGRLSGSMTARLDLRSGALTALAGDISADGAVIALTNQRSLVFERLAASLTYDPVEDRLHLLRLSALDRREDSLEAGGDAWLLRGDDGQITGVDGALRVTTLEVADPALFAAPLSIRGGVIDFAVDTKPLRLEINAQQLDAGVTTLSGRLEASLSPEFALSAEASLTGFEATWLPAIWPLPAAPGGRSWVEENIVAGRLEGGKLTVKVVEDAIDAMEFRFHVADLESTYIEGMTPITGGRGEGVVTADSFTLSLETAQVDLGADGVVRLDGSGFEIPDINAADTNGVIDIRAQGRTAALLRLLDQPPLGLISKLGRDLGAVGGSVEARGRLTLPLISDVSFDQIGVKAEAGLSELTLIAPWLEREVSAREATLEVDAERLRLRGDMRVDGQTVTVDWREVFSPGAADARSELGLGATLSAEQLVKLGAPGQIFVDGGLRAEATLKLVDGAAPSLDVELDLRRMLFAAPLFGWSKPVGEAGSARLQGAFAQGGLQIYALSVRAGALRVSGSGSFGEGGVFRSMSFDQVAIGKDSQLALTVTREDDGAWRVTGGGPKLTAAAGAFGAGAEGRRGGAPVAFELSMDEVLLGSKARLLDVDARGGREADGVLVGEVSGHTATGAPVVLSMSREGGQQHLLLSTEQAGEALVGLGLVGAASGGRLRLFADIDAAGVAEGRLEIDDLVLRDAPAGSEGLAVGSLVSVFQTARSGGVTLTRTRAPFRLTPTALELREAWATGPAVGVVLAGTIGRADGALSLEGTISPLMAINGVLSDIPVIGDLLTGGSGAGIVAVNFSVRGDTSDPQMLVNPLTAFAPGVFRRIFRGGIGDHEGVPVETRPGGGLSGRGGDR